MESLLKNLLLKCPACGEISTEKIGHLRNYQGVIHLSDPGNLYHCLNCNFFFRRPYISGKNLVEKYSKLPADKWEYAEGRPDFCIAERIIKKLIHPGCILDVGCYRGDFLMRLPDTCLKYGIEPVTSARKIAEQRGIILLGSDIEHAVVNHTKFQAIVMLDVIEHLPYPMDSLKRLVKLLQPSGIIILSTGNTNALPWRLMRLDYWYYFTEHFSFFNPQWFHWASQRLGLAVVMIKKYSHFNGSIFKRLRQFAQCLAYFTWSITEKHPLSRALISYIYPFNRVSRWSLPPKTQLWKDHILVVLKSKT